MLDNRRNAGPGVHVGSDMAEDTGYDLLGICSRTNESVRRSHRRIEAADHTYLARTEMQTDAVSCQSRPQVDYDSFLDGCTRISGSHPTCLCGKLPTLHGSLLEGKQGHPLQGKDREEENANANAAEGGDKQRQTRRTCLEGRTLRDRDTRRAKDQRYLRRLLIE